MAEIKLFYWVLRFLNIIYQSPNRNLIGIPIDFPIIDRKSPNTRVKPGSFGHQVNSDMPLQTVALHNESSRQDFHFLLSKFIFYSNYQNMKQTKSLSNLSWPYEFTLIGRCIYLPSATKNICCFMLLYTTYLLAVSKPVKTKKKKISLFIYVRILILRSKKEYIVKEMHWSFNNISLIIASKPEVNRHESMRRSRGGDNGFWPSWKRTSGYWFL